jgi:hypothetical protein
MDVVKALIEGVTQDIIAYLVEDDNISIEQAMETVYNSTLFDKLSDPETGLYRESSAYVYSLLKDEMEHGEFVQVEV